MQKHLFNVMTFCMMILASFSPLSIAVSHAQLDTKPKSVNIPGTPQDDLGCSGLWQPECENTMLALCKKETK